MKHSLFLLSGFVLLFAGCTSSPNYSYWQKGWDDVNMQYATAKSWDELPYPWLIEQKGKYWVTDQTGGEYKNAGKVLNERQAEVKRFLQMVNEKRRQWYVNEHPELPAQTVKCILEGTLQVGMTAEQAMASWGHHGNRINRSVGSWGVHEQWIYGEYARSYLYFENGILTSWQD